jgi:hypothetical protein
MITKEERLKKAINELMVIFPNADEAKKKRIIEVATILMNVEFSLEKEFNDNEEVFETTNPRPSKKGE